MSTITVYKFFNCWDDLEECVGVMFGKGVLKDCHWNPDDYACTLHYAGNLDELRRHNSGVWAVGDSTMVGEVPKQLYFDRKEAIAAAVAAGVKEQRAIDCAHYIPLKTAYEYCTPTFPIVTVLNQNARGLHVRLNLHPEEDGRRGSGKLFFPDRACTNKLCVGPVVINSVKDKGSYGFFEGEMIQFCAPDQMSLSDYIVAHDLYNAQVRYMKGKLGDYIAILDARKILPYTLVQDEEGVRDCLHARIYAEDVSKCTQECFGYDIVCRAHQSCDFDEFYKKFVPFQYGAYRASHSNRFVSELFDEAENACFVSMKTMYNVDFVDFSRESVMEALDQFSPEEMEEIIATIKHFNDRANAAIARKVKNGKLALR